MRLDPSGFDYKGGMQRVYTLLWTFGDLGICL